MKEKCFIIQPGYFYSEENPSAEIPCTIIDGEHVDCTLSADQAGLTLCLNELFDNIHYVDYECKYFFIPFHEILCPLSYFSGMHYEIHCEDYLLLHIDDFNREIIKKNAIEALASVKRRPIHFTVGDSMAVYYF